MPPDEASFQNHRSFSQGHGSVLIAGVGSAGYRHLENLATLGVGDLTLFRTGRGSPAVEPEEGAFPVETDLASALATGPAAVVVANPTALHVPTALEAARAGAHLLLEKPVSHSLEGVPELMREVEKRGLVTLVAFQFRFHPTLRKVRTWLQEGRIGSVVSAHAFWGEYLPDWHPWEDYRASYTALKELGGGVIHTLSHPMDYLGWLLGPVETVRAEVGRLSGLDVQVEDTALLVLRHAGGAVSSVYLDYARRPPRHDLEIVGTRGTIRWDNADGRAHLYEADKGRWASAAPPEGFERNHLFLAEARHFLACLAGDETPECTLEDGVETLRIALAAHASAEEGRRLHV